MMSEILLPPGIALPARLQQRVVAAAAAETVEGSTEKSVDPLPVPTGFNLLCICPDVDEKFEDSALVRPDASRRQEEHGTTVLFVLRMGPEAYKDKERFPSGPWCKVGDFVVVRTYTGTRLKIFGKEMRILKDDQIEAVVADPRGVSRV